MMQDTKTFFDTFFFCFQRTRALAYEIQSCLPNSEVFKRKPYHAFKKMIQDAIKRDYTDILVINEDRGKPSILFHKIKIRERLTLGHTNNSLSE